MCSAISLVRIARRRTLVCTTSGRTPCSFSSSPPRRASSSPLASRSTSTQPVKRFLAFHSLLPCRSSTKVPVMVPILPQPLFPRAATLSGDHHMENRLPGPIGCKARRVDQDLRGERVSGWFRQATGGLPRQFWFLWTGTLINRLGSFVVIFLAIYLTGERHFSSSRAGLVIGLYGVGGAVGTTVGGVLADRWGRRPTMLTAQFTAAALMLTLGFADAYWQIAGVTLLLGFFSEAVRPAFSAMMVDVVPDKDRVRAFSLNYWAVNLGFALSAVGAGLAAKADYLLLFVIDAGTTLVTALIGLIFLAETRPSGSRPSGTPSGSTRRPPRGGLLMALRDR